MYIHGALSSRRQMDHVTDVLCVLYTQYAPFFHNLTATVATLTHGNSHTHARTHEHAELVLRFVSIFAVYCCQVRATVNGFLFCTSFYLSLAKASAKNQLFFFCLCATIDSSAN